MLRCAHSRSTFNLILAGGLTLAFAMPAFGQSGLSPVLFAPETAADAQATSPTAPSALQPAVPPPSAAPTSPSANALQEPSAQNYTPPANTGTLFAYSLASVPDMIGDPGHGRYYVAIQTTTATATLPNAAGAAYAKIADDTSPIPTDRVFSDYNYFNRAIQTANGAVIGLSTYTIGVEKTFFCGWCSVEVEAPIVTGLNDQQDLVGTTGENQGTVFGDMSVTFKCLVYQQESLAISVGTMVDLPTAPTGAFNAFGTTLTINNNSVHVAPFVGFVYRPCCSNFFALGFVQADVDCNGDPVRTSFVEGDPRLRDPSLLYLDLSMGYWLLREDQLCCRYLTGIAPTVELHYTTTLQNAHGVSDDFGDSITPLYAGTDCLSLTGGLHFQMGPRSMFTVAAALPLRDSQRDREFDSELLAEFDRRF